MRYKKEQYSNKVQKTINDKQGILLSKIEGSLNKVIVLCANNHEFKISPAKIQQNRWCPHCRKIPFETIEKFVKSKGGKVSGNFEKMLSKLTFTCDKNHSWKTGAANVCLQNTWCPVCSGVAKVDITEFHKIAESFGGKCLSDTYDTQQDKLEFICKNNHHFFAAAKHVRAKHWCPDCRTHYCEEICRKIFEKIFNATFIKTRPEWLINDKGYKLELDGYSSKFGIAFEHQGRQHYGIDIFGMGEDRMKKISENDICKKSLCIKHNVKLIEIPELFNLTKTEDLLKLLLKKFDELNITEYDENIFNNISFSDRKLIIKD